MIKRRWRAWDSNPGRHDESTEFLPFCLINSFQSFQNTSHHERVDDADAELDVNVAALIDIDVRRRVGADLLRVHPSRGRAQPSRTRTSTL